MRRKHLDYDRMALIDILQNNLFNTFFNNLLITFTKICCFLLHWKYLLIHKLNQYITLWQFSVNIKLQYFLAVLYLMYFTPDRCYCTITWLSFLRLLFYIPAAHGLWILDFEIQPPKWVGRHKSFFFHKQKSLAVWLMGHSDRLSLPSVSFHNSSSDLVTQSSHWGLECVSVQHISQWSKTNIFCNCRAQH